MTLYPNFGLPNTKLMKAGKLIFAEIPRLNKDWQDGSPSDDPANVWTVWDKNSFYTWGANHSNISGIPIGQSLHGEGMAGVSHGPTRGLAHPHYPGINSMEYIFMSDNDTAFTNFTNLISQGKNIVIPIFHDHNAAPGVYKYSLGTGLGANVSKWGDIQKYIFNLIVKLSTHASSIDIPNGVYWPDCRNANRLPHYPISDISDIQKIINIL